MCLFTVLIKVRKKHAPTPLKTNETQSKEKEKKLPNNEIKNNLTRKHIMDFLYSFQNAVLFNLGTIKLERSVTDNTIGDLFMYANLI